MSKAGISIIHGAEEALEFVMGENNGCAAHLPDEIDVVAIRSKLNMSQIQFASMFGFNRRTLQDWEQGRCTPADVSKVLLKVLSKDPDTVIRALKR